MRGSCGGFASIIYFLSAVSAAPTPNENGYFKIHRRATGSTAPSSGFAALGKAYRKYGWEVPGALNEDFQISQNISMKHAAGKGSVSSTPGEADVNFLSPIKIGGQTLMMNFDTGSSDLWVFNALLPSEKTKGHSIYDPRKSRSFLPLPGASWKVQYGDGSGASGIVGFDNVDIGGAKVRGQAIEMATKISDQFVSDIESDGLVGLGFGNINQVSPKKQKTFFENVMPSLDKPVFTANLRHHEVGSYEFGRIDDSQFKGPITYTNIDPSHGFWEIESKSFSVGSGPKQTNPNATPAIVDTGTTLMLLDDNVVRSYWRQVQDARIGESGIATFPCNAPLPDFHVALGPSYMATIPGALINFSRGSGGRCVGGLQSNNGGGKQIYGDVLFKAQFVVFDGGNKAVGFAPHK